MIKRNWSFLVGLLISISLLWPLFVAPYFTHHDDVQVIRLHQMDRCIKDFQIPCRWVPDLGNLYGYPIFNYYAPLPYYFGEIFYLISANLIFSVKVMFAASFLGSFVFMFLLTRKFWGNLGGSLSAIFYSLAPYHALDFYVRGAMGELWALMFFPAIFWAFTRLEEKTNILNSLLCGLFITALIISHNLSALIFLPITLVWIAILFLKRKQKKFLYFSLISLILGVLLSSFYLLPMLLEKNLVHVDTTTVGYFSYTEHFKGFRKLLLERDWEYGASIREVPGGERDGLSYQIGWVHLLGWFLALLSIKFFQKKNPWVLVVIIVLSLIITFSIFMVNPRSEFIWKVLEPLKYLQFPWRFLIIITFLISFLAGASLYNFRKKRLVLGIWAILVILVVALNFSYFRPEKFIYINDPELLSGENWERQIKRSILDFLPISAKEPPAELATSRYQILTGDVEISDFRKGSDWIYFKAKAKNHSIIRLSQYYFPDWKILVNGKMTDIDYKSNNLGLITFILGEGDYTVEAKLHDTPIRNISNLITGLTFILIIILFLLQYKNIRKWILYYRKRID